MHRHPRNANARRLECLLVRPELRLVFHEGRHRILDRIRLVIHDPRTFRRVHDQIRHPRHHGALRVDVQQRPLPLHRRRLEGFDEPRLEPRHGRRQMPEPRSAHRDTGDLRQPACEIRPGAEHLERAVQERAERSPGEAHLDRERIAVPHDRDVRRRRGGCR